jgi:4-hydroxythreonine-4-phosphate dehydrogenase
MGEPAGIGGEIAIKAWKGRKKHKLPPFFVIGDPEWLAGIDATIPVAEIADPMECVWRFNKAVPVLPLRLAAAVIPGQPDPRNAQTVLDAIRLGVDLAQTGAIRALVTNPIEKAVLYNAGFSHPGHTEFLAELTGATTAPVMLLACPPSANDPGLRVALVTVHVPLAQVASKLSRERIIATAQAAAQALRRDFGVAAPRVAVAALNPHGGEQGALGREEIEIIAPAVNSLRTAGIDAHGPFPADTLFHAEARRKFDCVICMYHDQALIPLKTIDFARGVNVTLGLNIVRTSPDHGVALDIAGKGLANPASLIAALQMARDIARYRDAP